LADGRQPEIGRDLNIVVTHNREVLRDGETGVAGGFEHAERVDVAAADDGGRPRRAGQ
jgi:hypothetical protein